MLNTKLDEPTASQPPTNPIGDPGNPSDRIQNQMAAAVLNATVPAVLALLALAYVATWLAGTGHQLRHIPTTIAALSLLVIWGLVRTGRISLAARAYIAALCVAILSGMILNGGVHAVAFPALMPLLAMVGWLYGGRTAVTFMAVSVVTGGAFVWLDAQGWLREPPTPPPTMIWITTTGYLLITLAVTVIPSRMLRQALLDSEARRLEAERVSRVLADRERTLRESERKTHAIFDLAFEFIGLLESDGTLVEANRTALEFAGIQLSDVVGKPFWDTPWWSHSPEMQERLRAAVRTANGGELARFEATHPAADGSLHDIDVSLKPIKDETGRVVLLIPEGRDITERKRTRELLLESEQFARATLDGLSAHIAIVNATGIIEAVNKAWRDFATSNGPIRENVCEGTNYLDICERASGEHSEGAAGAARAIRDVLEGRLRNFTSEYPCHSPDTQRWFSQNITRFPGQGPARVVIAHENITERKQAEAQLRGYIEDVERFNRMAVGREQRIIEMKRKINDLSQSAGLAMPYQATADMFASADDAESRLAPASNIGEPSAAQPHYELAELLDIESMQLLLNSFCDAVGNAAAIIDLEGRVLVGARWQRICTDFHRIDERTFSRCIESDTRLAADLRAGQIFSMYRCLNGLTDAASPIIIEGRHVANVFVGQFLLTPPDEEFFRKQCREFGFDENEYLAALRQVPVIPEEKLPSIIGFLTSFANLVGRMGLDRLRGKTSEDILARQAEELRQAVGELNQQRQAALSLAEDANEARLAAEQARESLRISEEQYRLLFEHLGVGVVVHSADTSIRYSNPEASRILGLLSDELSNRQASDTVWSFTQEDGSVLAVEDYPVTKVLAEGKPLAGQVIGINRSATNDRVWVVVSGYPVFDASQVIDSVVITFMDVTDRKNAAEALRASQATISSIFSAAPVGIGMTANRVLLRVNDHLCNMVGYSREELIGQNSRLLYPTDEEFEYVGREKYRQIRERGTGTVETQWRRKDGAIINIILSSTPLDQSNHAAGVTFTALDISARKQMEDSLRKSEENYRRLFNAINDVIFVHGLTPDGKPGNFIQANDAACRLYGYRGDEWSSMSPLDMDAPEGLAMVSEAIGTLKKEGHAIWEGMHHDKNGRKINVEINAVYYEREGVPMILSVVRDITERKRAEESLRENLARFEGFAQATQYGMGMADLDGKIVYANATLARMLGEPSVEACLGKHFPTTYYPPDSTAKLVNEVLPILRQGGSWLGELEILTTDGRRVPMEENYFVIRGQDGQPRYLADILTDITERKRAQDKLRESELFLKEIQRIARLGGWKANPHTDYLEWTDEVYEIVEATRDYKPVLSEGLKFYDSEYIPLIRDSVARCLATGEPFAVECRGTTTTGTKLWVEVRGLMPMLAGENPYVMGTFQDITERKRAEEAIRESEARFSTAFHLAPISIAISLASNGNLVDINDAFVTLIGYTREDVIGRNAVELGIWEDPELRASIGEKLVEIGEVYNIPAKLRTKSGKILECLYSAANIMLGGVPHVIAQAMDITEIKRTQAMLREREEALRALVETTQDWIWAMDATGTHIYSNPACRKILGYSHDRIVGHQCLDLLHEEDRKTVEANLPTWIAQKRGWRNVILRWRHENGSYRYLESSSVPILDLNGNLCGFRGVDRDITERKQAEDEIRKLNEELEQRVKERTAQLAAANTALNEFAYVVSHDLKAPLRAVNQLAQWIAEDYSAVLDEEGKSKVGLMEGRIARMYALIDGILAYSRIGRIEENRIPVDMNTLVAEVIESLAPPDHIRITFENRLPVITADRTRMEQVFQNLIGNAIKYMDKTEGLITIGCEDNVDNWRFRVTDNGPGIDPKYHEKVFGIFQTLAPRDRQESTGIGLSLVKKIVEMYGGKVELASQVGKGCTFSFTLPK